MIHWIPESARDGWRKEITPKGGGRERQRERGEKWEQKIEERDVI